MRHLYSITIVSDEVDGVLNGWILEGLLCIRNAKFYRFFIPNRLASRSSFKASARH